MSSGNLNKLQGKTLKQAQCETSSMAGLQRGKVSDYVDDQ